MSEPTEKQETAEVEEDDLFLPDEDEGTVVELVDESAAASSALEAEVEALRAERDELKDRYLRKAADFENARRRHQKEKDDMTRYAAERVLRDIVGVLDDLERAAVAARTAGDTPESASSLREGVEMVIRKFSQTLERHGVSGFASEGHAFDPNLHEALQRVDDTSVPHNTVVREFQKGYRLHERLLRPAMVIVAQGGAAGAEALESPAAIDDDAEPNEA